MTTIVCCSAKTDRRAQLIRKELRKLGYDECFEERIQRQELLLSVRVHFQSEENLILKTMAKAGASGIETWVERAA